MSETNDQVEHAQITTALEVEQLEVNLFRSKSLWVPVRGRGVFGGQVISQALVSATKCVDPAFGLHSLHCYFLLSASPSTPIVYQVERVRQGRTYCACSVKAVQNGKIIFVLMCSFQKPEPWQPSYQWTMPKVPSPDECELEEDRYAKLMEDPNVAGDIKKIFKEYAADRTRSPIAVKAATSHEVSRSGVVRYSYWMKAKNIPKYEPHYQKCILSYLSDLHFINTIPRIMGMKRFTKGPDAVSMTSTIDHSVYFYTDKFDCGDWLLYVMTSPRAASGRGVMRGQLFSRDGTLVAITSQEGVVRADIRSPKSSKL
ncbi:acyl-coenzyme a thioesterase 8 [Moniliophthora roreri MCA 2997]|uniref:Acyl-coenzyme a thioesterase 8 n=1 Tax=Moniliophthora roreri (strain MCA 2997) TaxID=1381753 RepID=V2Z3B5_MONRO|nr:acyl-coenzyme a thioesterase 8 [Moniliophthora roreri MCA 2997]